mgnify:CR=1 FL=1
MVSKWKTATQNVGLPLCKHSIAGLFATRNPGEDENAGVYVEEPSEYPTYEGRQSFEKKLADEFKNKSFIKYEQISRSDLTNVDLSWSLIQLLGMSEQELGEILGNSETSSIPFIEVTTFIYILSGQKFIGNAKNGPICRVFENLKLAVTQSYQTGQF